MTASAKPFTFALVISVSVTYSQQFIVKQSQR